MSAHEIFAAIDEGDADGVRGLLAVDPTAAAARDAEGVSALSRALYGGRADLVETLLAARQELDVFEAAAVGRDERVGQLLDADSTLVSAGSADGFTPLHLAAFFGHGQVVVLLLDRGAPLEAYATSAFAPVTPLQSAAAAGHTDIARRLLDAGANVNARGRDSGYTPLHAAAQSGNLELARLLLERGADPSATTDDGRTPRDLAAANDELLALLAG